MLKYFFGITIMIHGLIHLWYFLLSQRLVEFKAEMGWSGRSWLLTNFLGDPTTRLLASLFLLVSMFLFVVSGLGMIINKEWSQSLVLFSAILSSVVLLVFWDGNTVQIVEKGLIGLVFNIVIIIAILGIARVR